MTTPIITTTPGTPSSNYHPHLSELIDIDAQHPNWVQHPQVEVEVRSPRVGSIYIQVLNNIDSMVRQNSFAQRSQTCDLVLHDVLDWIHPTGTKAFHSMYRLIVREGYSGQMIQTFAGWITDVDYSNFPQEVKISASDLLFLAHSYFILDPLDYQGIAAEDATCDLLSRCGIDTNYVNINWDGGQSFRCPPLPSTDSTVGKNGAIFAYQNMDTALTNLTQMYGFSYWCDVSGYIQFQYVRPFPQAQPTVLPFQNTLNGHRFNFEIMDAVSANAHYSTSGLPGNLLKVVSHKYSASDMRNLIGVYNGLNAPYYAMASPGIPGWPNPSTTPRLSSGGVTALAAKNNIARLGYFTSAMLMASDLIAWDVPVLAHPDNPGDASTTTFQDFIAQRLLHDLNIEAEATEVVTFGNPYVDLGQTVYIKDIGSFIDGMFFVLGYQTRFDSKSGYTTQLKTSGGPTWNAIAPSPRPTSRTRKRADGNLQSFLDYNSSWTSVGSGSLALTISAA